MTATRFYVIGLHLPCRLRGSRCHEDQQTKCEKAYLLPASHVYLLVPLVKSIKFPALPLAGRILLLITSHEPRKSWVSSAVRVSSCEHTPGPRARDQGADRCSPLRRSSPEEPLPPTWG